MAQMAGPSLGDGPPPGYSRPSNADLPSAVDRRRPPVPPGLIRSRDRLGAPDSLGFISAAPPAGTFVASLGPPLEPRLPDQAPNAYPRMW